MSLRNINKKMIQLVKMMKTLKDEDLEKVLINRTVLDRIYLFKKSNKTNIQLLESLTFKDLVQLESLL